MVSRSKNGKVQINYRAKHDLWTEDFAMNSWAVFTVWFVGINLVAHVVLIVIAIVGGFFDLSAMLKDLENASVDETDDGRV